MKRAKLFSTGIFVLCQFLFHTIYAQQGKDGAGNINVANTVVNIYTRLTANATAGVPVLKVNSTAGFAPGDLVFVIQMYGAAVNAYTDANPTNSLPNDTSYGKVINWNNPGNNVGYNEFAQVNAVPDGITLNLDCGLKHNYTGTNKVQVIRVPRYTTLTLTAPGSITCPAWGGQTGGVVVIEVKGNTVINNGASINVVGMGFRGGAVHPKYGSFGATNTGSTDGTNGARKGESIVGDTNYYKLNFSGTYCSGNVANGGGGGDANNCGGGGGSNAGLMSIWNGMGNPDLSTANNIASWNKEPPINTFTANVSSGGGRGGYAFSSSNGGSADPTVTGPGNGGVWGGDSRHNNGGWGGIPLDYSTGRIFLGGGGGAGDDNDGWGSSGANGGGIVYLMSYGTVTGAGQILADGAAAAATNTAGVPFGSCGGIDGAGGGGGGGVIFVNSVGAITLTNATPLSAQGGKGGDNKILCNFSTNHEAYGPGGGGGGGYIATSNVVTNNVNGGVNGIVSGSGSNYSSNINTKFPPNGATKGGVGTSTTTTNFYLTTTNYTICAGSTASLSVTIGGTPPGGIVVNWYSTVVGGSPVFSGNPYVVGPLAIGTYTYYVGTCPGTYRDSSIVTVLAAPTLTATATPTVVCNGQSSVLTASGATSYTWSANAGSATTSTVSVSPGGNTTYTVTGANGTCTATKTVSVVVSASPTIAATPSNTVVCSGTPITFTASGATSYTWSANAGSATTATISVSPTVTATYTVTGDNGGCTATQTVAVTVTPNPTVTIVASPGTICKGSSAVLTANGAASYTWSANAGSATTSTVSVSPNATTTYTVTGVNGNCSATQTSILTVNNPPTKADSVLNSASCNQSNGSYVINSVTGGTGPYQINFNNTGFSNIPSFAYTVPNLASGIYPVTIKDNVGCTYTTSITILNTGGITAATDATIKDTCGKSVGSLTVTTVTGGTPAYQYSLNGVTYQASNIFNNMAAGNYTVTVKDVNGCTFTLIDSVKTTGAITTPTVTVLGPNVFCQGGNVTLSSSSATGNTWNTTATTQTISVNSSGTYSVVVSMNGCSKNSNTVSVTVNPTPTLTVINPTSICQGTSTTLSTGGATSYTWSPTSGINSTTSATVTANPTVTTTYTIIGTNGSGCKDTIMTTVTVAPAPTQAPGITPDTLYYCLYQTTNSLTATSSGGAILNWYDSNMNPLPGSPTPTDNSLGITTYYISQSIGNCKSPIDSIKIIVIPGPSATFVTNPASNGVMLGQPVVFTPVNVQSSYIHYNWNFNDPYSSTSTSVLYSPTHTYADAGTFCTKLVVVSTQTGCKDSSTICIDVINGINIVVPNFFSPNGDQINDVFSVKASGISTLTCDIYDRWGIKMYSWNGITGYWDGNGSNGKAATDGTYYYVIDATDVKGEARKYNGFLQLLK